MALLDSAFFGPVPEGPREDVMRAHLTHLEKRNGTTDAKAPYPRREEWLARSREADAQYEGVLDHGLFERSFRRYDRAAASSSAMIALLAFVKLNASEAYGVEVLEQSRAPQRDRSNVFDHVEALLVSEENYHTRILLGAARQFGVAEPRSPYRPPLMVQGLMQTLSRVPKSFFHPVLLGGEVGGIFAFHWMLKRVGKLFPDQPRVREMMEQRLIEILIDEVGHAAFNRQKVGPAGIRAAAMLAPHVAHYGVGIMPEVQVLGWDRHTPAELESFDLSSLPAEVRDRGFFA